MNQDSSGSLIKEKVAIDRITDQFFDLFTNTNGRIPNLRKIDELFLPGGFFLRRSGQMKGDLDRCRMI